MPSFLQVAQRRTYGKISVAFGTVITRLVEPRPGAVTTIADMWYTAAGTAHTLTVFRPLGKTYTSAAAAASQAVININYDPGLYSNFGVINTANNGIAANDYCVYELADGTFTVDTVSSVSSLAITMSNNVGTATVLKGAPFWWYGITTDTNPADGNPHPQYTAVASTLNKWGNDPGEAIAGVVGSIIPSHRMQGLSGTNGRWPLSGVGEPLIVQSNNITATGTLEKVTAIYTVYA